MSLGPPIRNDDPNAVSISKDLRYWGKQSLSFLRSKEWIASGTTPEAASEIFKAEADGEHEEIWRESVKDASAGGRLGRVAMISYCKILRSIADRLPEPPA